MLVEGFGMELHAARTVDGRDFGRFTSGEEPKSDPARLPGREAIPVDLSYAPVTDEGELVGSSIPSSSCLNGSVIVEIDAQLDDGTETPRAVSAMFVVTNLLVVAI